MQHAETTDKINYLELSLVNESGKASLSLSLIKSLNEQMTFQKPVSAVIIKGNKENFCTGLDLEKVVKNYSNLKEISAALMGLRELLQKLENATVPIISVVEAPALGGGLGFVAVSDFVLATNNAHFSLPETVMGLIPAVVFPYIVRRIGLSKARLLALSAKPIIAEVACQMGLVDEVGSDAIILLKKQLERLRRVDKNAIHQMKQLINDHFSISTHYYDDAIKKFTQLINSASTQERLERFSQGEAPWESHL